MQCPQSGPSRRCISPRIRNSKKRINSCAAWRKNSLNKHGLGRLKTLTNAATLISRKFFIFIIVARSTPTSSVKLRTGGSATSGGRQLTPTRLPPSSFKVSCPRWRCRKSLIESEDQGSNPTGRKALFFIFFYQKT